MGKTGQVYRKKKQRIKKWDKIIKKENKKKN